mgnify:CR=1 FL=1
MGDIFALSPLENTICNKRKTSEKYQNTRKFSRNEEHEFPTRKDPLGAHPMDENRTTLSCFIEKFQNAEDKRFYNLLLVF